MPEISIIVPVYKVEKYLLKCIDSILAQTFTDFELILVDDGSPDRCGEICDQYADKDPRIVVIHKQNGGLSSARNAGLDIAKGKYIGFVDSDDYIAADMYETLYRHLIDNDADVSICETYHCYRDSVVSNTCQALNGLTDNISALRIMLEQKYIDVFACNKLYKKKIFEDLRYPHGKTYEDLYIIVDIMLSISTVYIDTIPKYYYVHREGSITTTGFNESDLNYIDACKRNEELINEYCPEILDSARYRLYRGHIVVLAKLLSVSRNKRNLYRQYINHSLSFIRKNLYYILSQPFIKIKFKLSSIIISLNPWLYILALTFYRRYKKAELSIGEEDS